MLTWLTLSGLTDAQIQLISGHSFKKSPEVYQHLGLAAVYRRDAWNRRALLALVPQSQETGLKKTEMPSQVRSLFRQLLGLNLNCKT
jgi:hypothetical protein